MNASSRNKTPDPSREAPAPAPHASVLPPGDWHVRGPITVDSESFIPPAQIDLATIQGDLDGMMECGLRVTFVGLVPEGYQFAGWWRVAGTSVPRRDNEPILTWRVREGLTVEREAFLPPGQISAATLDREHEAMVELGLRVTSSALVADGERIGWWRVSGTSAPRAADAPVVIACLGAAAPTPVGEAGGRAEAPAPAPTFALHRLTPGEETLRTGLSADEALEAYEAAYDEAVPRNKGASFMIIDERDGLMACGLDLGTAGGAGGCECHRCVPSVNHEANEVADVPADLSKKSLTRWVSLIRMTALGFTPDSPERTAFLTLAAKNLDYAAWLLRGSKARAAFLKGEALKLPNLVSTIAD